ncbi:MAG: hypothetical protein WBA84_03920 [Carnobacterium sp.]|uniref:hypothetical protein n=1 Tax=Carnobacterium sp. TaxID=48221 RepID=UPI003C784E3E
MELLKKIKGMFVKKSVEEVVEKATNEIKLNVQWLKEDLSEISEEMIDNAEKQIDMYDDIKMSVDEVMALMTKESKEKYIG